MCIYNTYTQNYQLNMFETEPESNCYDMTLFSIYFEDLLLSIKNVCEKIPVNKRHLYVDTISRWFKEKNYDNHLGYDEKVILEESFGLYNTTMQFLIFKTGNKNTHIAIKNIVYQVAFTGIFFDICFSRPAFDLNNLIKYSKEFLETNMHDRYKLSSLWAELSKEFPDENMFLDNNCEISREIEKAIFGDDVGKYEYTNLPLQKSKYGFPVEKSIVFVLEIECKCIQSFIWTFYCDNM